MRQILKFSVLSGEFFILYSNRDYFNWMKKDREQSQFCELQSQRLHALLYLADSRWWCANENELR